MTPDILTTYGRGVRVLLLQWHTGHHSGNWLRRATTRARLHYQLVPICSEMVGIILVFIIINYYLQHCRSLVSLKSPGSCSSLLSSLLISLLISLCWRKRSSNLAVRSSQDLEMESGWPGIRPMWFSMPSEQDIRFRFKLGSRYTAVYFSSDGTEENPVT